MSILATVRKSDFCTLDDDGSTFEATGDYSVTPAYFTWGPPAGETWSLERLIVKISDGGGFSATEYGNLNSALTNGIQVQIRSGASLATLVKTLSGLKAVKTNADWGGLCYDVSNLGAGGSGDDSVTVRWTFSKDQGGQGIRLNGDDNEKLVIALNDSFVALDSHTFYAGGYKEKDSS